MDLTVLSSLPFASGKLKHVEERVPAWEAGTSEAAPGEQVASPKYWTVAGGSVQCTFMY